MSTASASVPFVSNLAADASRIIVKFIRGGSDEAHELLPRVVHTIILTILISVMTGLVATAAAGFQASGGLTYWLAYAAALSGAHDWQSASGSLAGSIIIMVGALLMLSAGLTLRTVDDEEIDSDLDSILQKMDEIHQAQQTAMEHLEGLTLAAYVRPSSRPDISTEMRPDER